MKTRHLHDLGGGLLCSSMVALFGTTGGALFVTLLGARVEPWMVTTGVLVAVLLSLLGALVYAHSDSLSRAELRRVEAELRRLAGREDLQ